MLVTEDRKAADVPAVKEDSMVEDNSAESAEPRAFDFEAKGESGDLERLVSRGINATLVLGFGTLAVTTLLTVDHDYWHIWIILMRLFSSVNRVYGLKWNYFIIPGVFAIGLGALATGWVCGSVLVPMISTFLIQPTWTLELLTSLVAYLFLFLAYTFLK